MILIKVKSGFLYLNHDRCFMFLKWVFLAMLLTGFFFLSHQNISLEVPLHMAPKNGAPYE